MCATENTTSDRSVQLCTVDSARSELPLTGVQLCTVDSARSEQPLTAACIDVTDQGRSIRISGTTERSALMKLYLKHA